MAHRFLPPIILLAAAACTVMYESDDQAQPARLADLLKSTSVIDLTHSFDAETIYWPTAEGFELTVDARGPTEGGYYYEANSFSAAEHGGTHLDAPIRQTEPNPRAPNPTIFCCLSVTGRDNCDIAVSAGQTEGEPLAGRRSSSPRRPSSRASRVLGDGR